jgi:hypothetical protein
MGGYILYMLASQLAKCINWSLVTNKENKIFLFNKNANTDMYCILFHDANPLSGHYETITL